MTEKPRSLHILLLDDDDTVLRLLKIFMKQLGHRVTTASNGREGIRQVLRHRFDLIIVDVQMPEVDGLEFARKVLEVWPWERIVLCTGFPNDRVYREAHHLGLQEVLKKPVSLNMLEEVINRSVDRSSDSHPAEQASFEVGYLRQFSIEAMNQPTFSSVVEAFPRFLRKGIPSIAAGVFAIQNEMGRYVISSDLPLDPAYLETITREITADLAFYSGKPLPCFPQPEVSVLHSRRTAVTSEGHQLVLVPMLGSRDMIGMTFILIPEEDISPPYQFNNLRIGAHHLVTVLECIEASQTDRMNDHLTGLWSWSYMEKQVGQAWALMEKEKHAVGWIDLDVIGFKSINDTLGFVTGDALLQSVARVIESHLEPGELCGRRAADEFCILLPATTPERVKTLSENLSRDVAGLSLPTEEKHDPLECAVGYAIVDIDHEMNSPSQLVECAEHARFVAEREHEHRVKSWEDLQETGEASINLHPVLVVDDDPQILVIIDRILSHTLYEVTGCTSVAEAVSIMQKGKRFEVMLTDLVLNHQDGKEMIRLGKEIDPEMIPMVISGNITKDSEEKLRDHGATEIIKKPFDPKYLRQVVASATETYTRNLRKFSAEPNE
jgi:diguanylate cyclase (GGDEF)-like protein